jgi:hypothetical protein
LRGPIARALVAAGASSVRVNVADEAVAECDPGLRVAASRPLPDGFVAFRIVSPASIDQCERVLARAHRDIAGYRVQEHCIRDDLTEDIPGERSFGFNLISFLRRPLRLEQQEWGRILTGSHAKVAVEAQSAFRYTYNIVIGQQTPAAPALAAIVEEGFPMRALKSEAARYDAAGCAEKFALNWQRMLASCRTFIDYGCLDRLPMSEFNIADEQ